jgi:putative membrane protein
MIKEMQTESSLKVSNVAVQEKTNLPVANTRLSAERTMMSVLRTGLSFISFGFTIYKFLQYVHESEGLPLRESGPRNMGLALIGIGLFILVLGSWQHWAFLKQLQRESAQKQPWSVALTGSLILGAVGVIAFITLIIRTLPFR